MREKLVKLLNQQIQGVLDNIPENDGGQDEEDEEEPEEGLQVKTSLK